MHILETLATDGKSQSVEMNIIYNIIYMFSVFVIYLISVDARLGLLNLV